MIANYDKYPSIEVSKNSNDCITGWEKIGRILNDHISNITKEKVIIVIDCYHGVDHTEIENALRNNIQYHKFYKSTDAFKSETEIAEVVYPFVTDDRVFGFVSSLTIEAFFDTRKALLIQNEIADLKEGIVIIYGEGAAYLSEQPDLLIYLDMARWEIQLRMRKNAVNNLGVQNKSLEFPLLYKQAFFVDWRVLDRHKIKYMQQWDFLIDTNKAGQPKMINGDALRKGLQLAAHQPFRVVPFFDPGPWGGQWLKEVIDLDRSVVNYAWGFDCVPEENSLLLKFGESTVEIPSVDLVLDKPRALLGDEVYEKFGAEFPIRFDFLDTMEGGNLSLQVHPTTAYIKEHFGMQITQDESYYMLEAKEDAVVYLGMQDDIKPEEMIRDLQKAKEGVELFDADKFVLKWPVKKHDHFLIPAGTVHCSGTNSVVLEISATPYNFTFKLWDWGRLGLDGKPRPINIEHGKKVINWDRKRDFTKENLINKFEKLEEGEGWTEERTGLYKTQFIETRRHWFTKEVAHNTNGGVNVLNLVEGREAIVESPQAKFEPFVVHYAETFIIPAAVGAYTIRPFGESEGKECATIKAYVRT